MKITIRDYQIEGAAPLAHLLQASVQGLAPSDYKPEQVSAWAATLPDALAIASRCADGRRVWVAHSDNGTLLGFTDLEGNGHIDMLYIAPQAKGKGVADALTDALIETAHAVAMPRLFVEASEVARRFYLKRGFVELDRRVILIEGVAIHNYAMALVF